MLGGATQQVNASRGIAIEGGKIQPPCSNVYDRHASMCRGALASGQGHL
jgi:hypothetical protein